MFNFNVIYHLYTSMAVDPNGYSSGIHKYVHESFAKPKFVFCGDLLLEYVAKSLPKQIQSRTQEKLSRGLMLEPYSCLCNGQSQD